MTDRTWTGHVPPPDQPRLVALAKATTATVGALGVVAGVPVGLVAGAGWPLPRKMPSPDAVADAFTRQGVPPDVLINTLAVVMWILWAQFVWALALETAALAGGRIAQRAPALPGLQPLAAHMVAAVALVASSFGPMRSAAAAPLATPAAIEQQEPLPDTSATDASAQPPGTPQPQRPDPTSNHTMYETQRGDTWWRLAEDHLGSGTRWREIRDLNVGRAVAPGRVLAAGEDRLDTAWRVLIPVDPTQTPASPNVSTGTADVSPGTADVSPGRAGVSPGTADVSPAPGPRERGDGEEEITVRPGDNFWVLAKDRLREEWGRDPTDGEIAPYWRQVVAANRDRLPPPHDPDLIFPAQKFVLPAVPVDPVDRQPKPDSSPPPSDAAPPDGDATTSGERDMPDAGADKPSPDADPADEPPVVTEAPPPATDAPEPGPTTTAPASTPDGDGAATTTPQAPSTDDAGPPVDEAPSGEEPTEEHDNRDDGVSPVVGLGAVSAVLAGLVLAALSRRRRDRRRKLKQGAVTKPRLADDIETERALAAAARDVRARHVVQVSRAFGTALRHRPDLPPVVGVNIGPNGQTAIYLAEPTDPVEPFSAGSPAGDRWLLHDDVAVAEGPTTLDTLVVVGVTDADETVLVDVESLGAVEIVGDERASADLARSIIAELAMQPAADDAVDLTVIGAGSVDQAAAEQGIVARPRLDEDLVRRIERTAGDCGQFLDQRGFTSTPAARASIDGYSGRDALYVHVVAAATPPGDDMLVERLTTATVPGGRGVAVVAPGPLGAGAIRIIVDAEGRVRVPHLGITAAVPRLTASDIERIDRLLVSELEGPTDPASPVEVVGDRPQPDAAPEHVAVAYEEPDWAYLVRLWADHQVETRDGHVVSFRFKENPALPNRNAHRGPELLAYLALAPSRAATASEIGRDLWWQRDVARETVAKMIHGTRAALGGPEMLSYQDDHDRYRLGPAVVTDVELLKAALNHARALAEPALAGTGQFEAAQAAIDVLRPQLARIEHRPFREGQLGGGLTQWAAAYRVDERLESVLVDAGLLVAKLCDLPGVESLPDALWAIDQALLACPRNEALTRTGMEIDAQLGHREAAKDRYLALCAQLAKDDLEPEDETQQLRSRIMSSNYQIG